MEEGQGKDPLLTIAGTFMKWIANSPFKFLGKQVCTDGSDKAARKLLMQKFEEYVTKIDETPLTGSQKNVDIRQSVDVKNLLGLPHPRHDSLICGRVSCSPDKDVQEMG